MFFKGQKILTAIVIALLVHTACDAQVDSMEVGSFITEPLKAKKSFTYGLNNRRSFIFEGPATIFGGYLGIQYGSKMKHVLSLNSNIFWNSLDTESQLIESQLTYVGLAEEFEVYRIKRLAFNSYVQLGVGISRYRSIQSNTLEVKPYEWVAPLELGIHVGYDIWDWFTLKSGGGYLFVWLSDYSRMNGPYYKVAVGVDFSKLISKWKVRTKA